MIASHVKNADSLWFDKNVKIFEMNFDTWSEPA